jgi:hypothetical protein
VRARTGIPAAQSLGHDILRVLAALMILFGLMFLIGGIVLLRWTTALGWGAVALLGFIWLRWLGPQPAVPQRYGPPGHEHTVPGG